MCSAKFADLVDHLSLQSLYVDTSFPCEDYICFCYASFQFKTFLNEVHPMDYLAVLETGQESCNDAPRSTRTFYFVYFQRTCEGGDLASLSALQVKLHDSAHSFLPVFFLLLPHTFLGSENFYRALLSEQRVLDVCEHDQLQLL